MSIRGEIANRCREKRLFALEQALPGTPTARTMFLWNDLNTLVLGPWDDKKIEWRAGRLRADLDAFVAGNVIAVATDPYKKKKTAYLSPVDPPEDHVWQIRSRDPKPGIRVFGHFSEKDVFVAMTWGLREELGGPGSREWRDARERCKTKWRKLFYPYKPQAGTNPHEHVSDIFLV